MSTKKNPNSRWSKGSPRFDATTENTIVKKYRERDGWHRGARVTKRDAQ